MIDRDGISCLGEADKITVPLTYLTKKIENLISTKFEYARTMKHVENACSICNLRGHTTLNCSTLSAFREALHEQANALNTFSQPDSTPYIDIYNTNF